jgi:hypothetical protein
VFGGQLILFLSGGLFLTVAPTFLGSMPRRISSSIKLAITFFSFVYVFYVPVGEQAEALVLLG